MKLTFLGANHEVTGSCTMLEAAGQRFLIDYGMEQGKNVYENQPLPVAPGEIDFVLITHAHIDHTGLLPLLAHNGFRGRIYATIPTVELCGIMLRDSAHIQEFEAEWKTARASAPAQSRWSPCTPCRMPRLPAACSGVWSTASVSSLPRASKHGSWTWDTCWALPASNCGSPRAAPPQSWCSPAISAIWSSPS